MAKKGRQKGSEKTPGSGRKKGTLNKDKIAVREIAKQYGVDPFEILLHFASNNYKALGYKQKRKKKGDKVDPPEIISLELRLRAASNACEYMYAKLKSLEHSGDAFNPLAEFFGMSPEERTKLREQIKKRNK